jgi:hypothetical protein
VIALLLLTSTLANAQPREDERIRRGEDIEAWRQVQDSQDPADHQAFIEEFPSSPLSELAYRRLNELDPAAADLNPVTDARLSSSTERHDRDLDRTQPQVAVATLSLAAPVTLAPEPTTRVLAPQMELGAMGWSGGPGVYVAGGLSRKRVSVWARGQGGAQRLDLALAARVSWRPGTLTPYAELVGAWSPTGSTLGLGGAVGVTQPLAKGFGLGLAVETMAFGLPKGVTLRLGATKTF